MLRKLILRVTLLCVWGNNMSNTETENHALLISKLAIERCQHKVSHLMAIIHLCGVCTVGGDALVVESLRDILVMIENDLEYSSKTLDRYRA